MSFQFFDPSKPVAVTHGHLPHWDQEGTCYFITWRTVDSIPKPLWEQWQGERNRWLWEHGIDSSQPDWRIQVEELPEEVRHDFRRFSKKLDDELDHCHGTCPLKRSELAQIVSDALHYFDGARYTLGDYVVMPNHVHMLVGGIARKAMFKQVESWKKWSALRINEALGRTGRLWQDEHYDHLVRSEAAYQRFRKYIADNPSKGRLRQGEYWFWRRPDTEGTA